MRLLIPPRDPITVQQVGEDLAHWVTRDEAAKRERARLHEQNAYKRSQGVAEYPEPDWATWQPLSEVLAKQAAGTPPLAGSPNSPDPTRMALMDHLGWQQLENLERYGKLSSVVVPREVDTRSGPLALDWGTSVQTLVFEANGGGQRPAKPAGPIIGRPGQGTHSYKSAPHNWQSDRAVDLRLTKGTPLLAIADGVVSSYGYEDAGQGGRFAGSRLHIEFGNDVAYYAHLSRLVVRPGQHVKEGQVIGYSGVASGVPHLHFAVKNSDPLAWVQRGQPK